MNSRWNKVLLWTEIIALFFGIPFLMFLDTRFSIPTVLLLPILALLMLVMRYRTDFKWRELRFLKVSKKDLRKDALIIVSSGIMLFLIVTLFFPDRLFNLPKSNPRIWIALGSFYPVFSAYPQEILYRTYIFRRYPNIFPLGWMKIAASGIAFSFVHILYYHPISMILTLVGGFYMASAYHRTGSVLYSAILHTALGMLVFSLGLGEFFWLEMYDYL